MSSPYLGEIRMFGGNFAPFGFALCYGQLLPIAQNDALYALVGTTYGGDGVQTFGLPDLQGRVPIHQGLGPTGRSFTIGEKSGTENVSLTSAQLPFHTHAIQGSTGNTVTDPTNGFITSALRMFAAGAPSPAVQMGPTGTSGNSFPHNNMQPYLTVTFVISLQGIFPTHN